MEDLIDINIDLFHIFLPSTYRYYETLDFPTIQVYDEFLVNTYPNFVLELQYIHKLIPELDLKVLFSPVRFKSILIPISNKIIPKIIPTILNNNFVKFRRLLSPKHITVIIKIAVIILNNAVLPPDNI